MEPHPTSPHYHQSLAIALVLAQMPLHFKYQMKHLFRLLQPLESTETASSHSGGSHNQSWVPDQASQSTVKTPLKHASARLPGEIGHYVTDGSNVLGPKADTTRAYGGKLLRKHEITLQRGAVQKISMGSKASPAGPPQA
ncbi:hypothetical protein FRC19_008650 [Serendipita sp. 401]|nr:hypothetical protein FRC15_008876 [Serendipita sp. 397]KAG8820727.1 hypothetical protein FRC19_008650 [Serendipita sp. 401]